MKKRLKKKRPLTIEEIKQYCKICRRLMALQRIIQGCDTCSEECSQVKRRQRNAIIASRKCLHCYRPSTPAERAQFKEFRRWLIEKRLIALPRVGRPKKNPEAAIHDIS